LGSQQQERRKKMAKSKTSGHRPGGGIKSRNKVEVGYRYGQQKKRTIPAGVAQLGQRQGNHITEKGSTPYGGVDLFAGTGFKSELGNKLAQNVGEGGPGKGRDIYKTGSQCQTGAVNPGNPLPKAKALFPGWEK
jgi:hypothetical protein